MKLLRVLQERQFSRLGSSAVVPLQARVLFATHRDLTKMVEAGDFRLDLYLPYQRHGNQGPGATRSYGRHPCAGAPFPREVFRGLPQTGKHHIAGCHDALLVDYAWPGNVREMENVIQKAIVLTDDDTICPEHLPDDLQQPDLLGVGDPLPSGFFEEQLLHYKIKIAQKALEECHGNKTLAARNLHISRTYLYRLIQEPLEEEMDHAVA